MWYLAEGPCPVGAGRHEWWCGQGKDIPLVLLLLLTSVVISSIVIDSSSSGFINSVKGHLARIIFKCLLFISRLNEVKYSRYSESCQRVFGKHLFDYGCLQKKLNVNWGVGFFLVFTVTKKYIKIPYLCWKLVGEVLRKLTVSNRRPYLKLIKENSFDVLLFVMFCISILWLM